MSRLISRGVDRREAAVAAAIGGAVLVIGGYGTGLGISTVEPVTAAITKAAPPSVAPAPMTMPAATLPPVSVQPAPQVLAVPTPAPILTAPIPTQRPPTVAPSSPPSATASSCPPSANGALLGGLIPNVGLANLTAPVTSLLHGLPVVGPLLDLPLLTGASTCQLHQPASSRIEVAR